jgi:hypothetical protein
MHWRLPALALKKTKKHAQKQSPWLLLSNFVSNTEPHCIRGVQPGGIYAHVVHREPTPGGPGSGWRRGSNRPLCQLPLWLCV